jgi:hypothetical protein
MAPGALIATASDLRARLSGDDREAFTRFLAQTYEDVEVEGRRQLSRTREGVTWLGLANLMSKQGYKVVSELEIPAALSWARHLGVISGDLGAPRTP